MRSFTQPSFWKAYKRLPARIRSQARDSFLLFQMNPNHPSLHFKSVSPSSPVYSARVSISYRAVGIVEDGDIVWFWIGSHPDYERLLKGK